MENEAICPLCTRPIPVGHESRHHLVPRSFRGRNTVNLHRICHRKIHSLFTERELAKRLHSIDALKAERDIRLFVDWVSSKPPAFYAPTARSRAKKGR